MSVVGRIKGRLFRSGDRLFLDKGRERYQDVYKQALILELCLLMIRLMI